MTLAILRATAPDDISEPVIVVIRGDANGAEAARQAALAEAAAAASSASAADANAAATGLANSIDFDGSIDPTKPFRFMAKDAGNIWRLLGTVDTASVWDLVGGLASLKVAGYTFDFDDTLYTQPRLLSGVGGDGKRRVVVQPGATVPDELVAARGTRTSLNLRLSQTLTDYGLLKDPVPLRPVLARLRAKEAKLLDGDTVLLTVALLGDSWTSRSLYSCRVSKRLKALYGDGGNGFVAFANSSGISTLPSADGRTGAVIFTITAPVGTWTANSTYTAPTANCCELVCSTVNGHLQIVASSAVATNTVAKLLYRPIAAASVRYSWDGGATWQTTLDLSSGYVATLNNLPATAGWTLLIEDLGGNAALTGLVLRKASGVLVHKMGSPSSTSAQWAAQAATAGFQAHWTELNPDCLTILHGTNDQTLDTDPTVVAANFHTIGAGVRTATPWTNQPPVDVMYVAPAENLRGDSPAMATYAEAVQEQADTDRAAYLNLQTCLYATTASGWWETDNLHPEETYGGPAMASAFIDMLTL